MAADLEPGRVRPDPVGVVDDRRGQPQHAALHGGDDGGGASAGRAGAVVIGDPFLRAGTRPMVTRGGRAAPRTGHV